MLPKTISITVTAVPQSSGILIVSAVVDGALAVPRVEDRADRQVELLANVLGKVATGTLAHDLLELRDELLPRLRIDLRIVLHAERLFEIV